MLTSVMADFIILNLQAPKISKLKYHTNIKQMLQQINKFSETGRSMLEG
jgi:hypothetical protein